MASRPRADRSAHIRSPWTQLGLFLVAELLLFLFAFLACTFLFGWRSPGTVVAFTIISAGLANLLLLFLYPFSRSALDYPIENWFRSITRKTPREDVGTLLRTARQLNRNGSHADAYRLFQHAISLEPSNPSLLMEIAQLCEQYFSGELALKYYKRLVDLGRLYVEPNILLNAEARLRELEGSIEPGHTLD